VIGIFTAALAAAGNAFVTFVNGQQQQLLEVGRAKTQSDLEKLKDDATLQLERDRAEADRILEVIKAGNPSQATNNLRFLLDTRLISTPSIVVGVKAYLEGQPSGSGPAFLPSTGSSPPPIPAGSQLLPLMIGISAYHADNLRLEFAAADATALSTALSQTQTSLYSRVQMQVLTNADATRADIFRALGTIATLMKQGHGSDLALVYFAGHVASVDSQLYLLPVDVDARDSAGIQASSMSADDFKQRMLNIAQYGRALVLLDTCSSDVDPVVLRSSLAGTNVSVIVACRNGERRMELPGGAIAPSRKCYSTR
jgi:hypothetical protein